MIAEDLGFQSFLFPVITDRFKPVWRWRTNPIFQKFLGVFPLDGATVSRNGIYHVCRREDVAQKEGSILVIALIWNVGNKSRVTGVAALHHVQVNPQQ